jgi:hypothetical protein
VRCLGADPYICFHGKRTSSSDKKYVLYEFGDCHNIKEYKLLLVQYEQGDL